MAERLILNKVIQKCLSLSLAPSQQMDRYFFLQQRQIQDFNLILLHRVFCKKFNSNKWNCVKGKRNHCGSLTDMVN